MSDMRPVIVCFFSGGTFVYLVTSGGAEPEERNDDCGGEDAML